MIYYLAHALCVVFSFFFSLLSDDGLQEMRTWGHPVIAFLQAMLVKVAFSFRFVSENLVVRKREG